MRMVYNLDLVFFVNAKAEVWRFSAWLFLTIPFSFRLEKLSAKENPFADEDDFRLVSLLKCDTLTRINKEDVNEGERAEARQMADEQVEE